MAVPNFSLGSLLGECWSLENLKCGGPGDASGNLLLARWYGVDLLSERRPPGSCDYRLARDGDFRKALLHCLINAQTVQVESSQKPLVRLSD